MGTPKTTENQTHALAAPTAPRQPAPGEPVSRESLPSGQGVHVIGRQWIGTALFFTRNAGTTRWKFLV